MSRFALSALLLASLATTSACAHAPAPAPGSAAAADGDRARQHSLRARREMTWNEYYSDVEQRTRRAGGFVMWFNPPAPIRRVASATEPANQPPGEAPVLTPMH
jgi:hypothetical protein